VCIGLLECVSFTSRMIVCNHVILIQKGNNYLNFHPGIELLMSYYPHATSRWLKGYLVHNFMYSFICQFESFPLDCGVMNEPFAICRSSMFVCIEFVNWWFFNLLPTLSSPIPHPKQTWLCSSNDFLSIYYMYIVWTSYDIQLIIRMLTKINTNLHCFHFLNVYILVSLTKF